MEILLWIALKLKLSIADNLEMWEFVNRKLNCTSLFPDLALKFFNLRVLETKIFRKPLQKSVKIMKIVKVAHLWFRQMINACRYKDLNMGGWWNKPIFIILTSLRLLKAQSSSVSAASYFPCRLYKAPKFFKVVVTVGESTLAALCQPPYSPYGAFSLLRDLFSSRSSATCQIGLLSPSIAPNSRSCALVNT